MKKQPPPKLNKWLIALHVLSAFAGMFTAGVCFDLVAKTGNASYILFAIIGVYVLCANFYRLWVLLAQQRGE